MNIGFTGASGEVISLFAKNQINLFPEKGTGFFMPKKRQPIIEKIDSSEVQKSTNLKVDRFTRQRRLIGSVQINESYENKNLKIFVDF